MAIIQFAFFPPHTTADRAMSVGQSKEQLARARAAKLRQAARKKQDDLDFLQLVNSANNARGVKVIQAKPKGNQPANQHHTENPGSPAPAKAIASTSTPPVVGSSWGKESDSVLRNFSRWADDYANAPEAQRQAMATDGLRLAAQRREIIAGLIQTNPQAAIAAAVPVWRVGEIPLDIRQMIEKRISGIGDLDVLGVTPAPDAKEPIKPVQRTAHFGLESYEASVYGRLATVGSQMDISMHGIVLDNQAALMDSQIELIEPGIALDSDKEFASSTIHPIDRMLANRGSPPRVAGADAEPVKYEYAQSGDKLYCLHCSGNEGWQGLMANVGNAELTKNNTTTGVMSRSWQTLRTDKKMLVALVDFSDMEGGVIPTSSAMSRANDVDTHLREVSYNQFGFTTKHVVPKVLRLPKTAAAYKDYTSTAGAYELAADTRALAIAAGYNPSDYHFFVIAFKGMDTWAWSGLGTIGKNPTYGHSIAWLNGNEMDLRIFAHELGHNLGLWHGDAWEQPPSTSQPDAPTGTQTPYGFYYDTMGSPWRKELNQLQYNAHFKNLLGWLPDNQIPTVTGNYSGRIYASDQTRVEGRHYALRIDANRTLGTKTNLDYYIEYRSRYTADTAINNGGLIYLSNPEASSESTFLLDMTPTTESYRFPYSSQAHDQALQNGQSFTDINNHWKIEITGRGGSGADSYLDVTINDLLNSPPAIVEQSTGVGDSTIPGNSPAPTVTSAAVAPVITRQPTDINATTGTTVDFTVDANGTAPITYQWQKNGVDLNGSTGSTLTLNNVQLTDNNSTYRVIVSNSAGSLTSNSARLTVYVPPPPPPLIGIGTQPGDVNATEGGQVIFTVEASGTAPITYQWQKDNQNLADAINFSIAEYLSQHDTASRKWLKDGQGQWCFITPQGILYHEEQPLDFGVAYWNNPTLLIGPNYLVLREVALSDAGSYRCVISNPSGSLNSRSATLAVLVPPQITGQPQGQTVAQNQAITLSVAASGPDLQYQWQKGGLNLPGETNATLAIASAQPSDAGSYLCQVSNFNGVVSSQAAVVTVLALPVINLNPVDTNATTGSNVALIGRATDDGQTTQAWETSADGTTWAAVSTGEVFKIAATFPQYNTAQRKWFKDSDEDWCYITPQGIFSRNGAQTQLQTQYWTNPDLLIGVSILRLQNVQPSHTGLYRLKASNTAGITTSNPATLTISN